MSTYPRPYRAGPIEPVVEVGQSLLVWEQGSFSLFPVGFIEPIPMSHPFVMNGGALAAAAQVTFNSQNILDLQYGQLAQLRFRVLDDIAVEVLEPQATARFATLNQNARINVFTELYDPCGHLTEIFAYENNRPFFRITNPGLVALAQTRIQAYGFKYVLVGASGEPFMGERAVPIARFTNILQALAATDAQGKPYRFTVVPIGGYGK